MPPPIALSLCILFIFILFRTDKRKESKFSSALWVPLIWLMIAGSRSVSYWLNPNFAKVRGGGDITAGDPINRSVLIILIILALFILKRRKLDWSNILKKNAWLVILFLYMGVSIFWSAYPAVSIKRWFRVIGDPFMVLVVLTENDPLAAVIRMFKRFAYVIIPLSLTFCKYFPKIGVRYTRWGGHAMWIGVTTHKNTLAIVSCISALVFLWAIIKEYRNNNKIIFTDIVVLLMSLFLLFYGKATSATSIVVFMIGICIFIILSKFKSKPKSIGSFVVAVLLISLLFFPVFELGIETVVESMGRNMTFTSRTLIWEALIKVGSNRPVWGSGYGSFWIEVRDHPMWNNLPGTVLKQAHNGYLNVWLELGFVGLGLLIGLILVTYKNIIKAFEFNFEYYQIRMVLLSMVLFHNVTEATFLRGTDFVWVLFLLATVFVPVNPSAALDRNQIPRKRLPVKVYKNNLRA